MCHLFLNNKKHEQANSVRIFRIRVRHPGLAGRRACGDCRGTVAAVHTKPTEMIEHAHIQTLYFSRLLTLLPLLPSSL